MSGGMRRERVSLAMAGILSAPRSPAPAIQQSQAAAIAAAAQAASARRAANLAFLSGAIRKKAVCAPASGAGVNQAYSSGQTLIYDVPTASGAYLDSILVECALTVNPATGAAATYSLNAGAPFNLIDYLVIEYNGVQARLRPLLMKWVAQLQGYERAQPSQVNSGQTVSWLQSTIWGAPFGLTVATNNVWNFWFRVPLRLFPRSMAGSLPIMSDSTKCQIKLQLSGNAMGNDPLTAAVANTGGTGASVTVGGTIAVVAEYRDGTNLFQTQALSPSLNGEPTVQYFVDSQLNPLTAGTVLRKRLDVKQPHLYVISVVVDGQQSTKFAANSNLAALELDSDFAGQNAFFRYGVSGSNISVQHFYEELQDNFIGQSLDEGVIPWVPGPGYLGTNPDNLEGASYLNMASGGWTDTTIGVQVGAVNGVANITSRIETYEVSLNPLGLVRS